MRDNREINVSLDTHQHFCYRVRWVRVVSMVSGAIMWWRWWWKMRECVH